MGITVRHDPSPGSMYRVARKAGAAEVAEQRRQEALRQQQIDAELAARAAAQKAGFEQQKAMFGLEKDARADYREDVQAHEREGWEAQAKRAADQLQQRERVQIEAEQRAAEKFNDRQFADMMTQSGHAGDARDFLGLLAQRDRKRMEVSDAQRHSPEYMDVLKDELIQLEAKVTEFKENGAKYKVPTLDEQFNKEVIVTKRDEQGNPVAGWTKDKNGQWQLKSERNVDKKDPAAEQAKREQEREKAQAAKDKTIDDRNLRQYDRAKRSWEARRKEALANAKAAEMLKKPKPLAEEKPEDYQAKLSRWESGLQERIEAAAAPRIPPEPEPPVPVADQRYEQELAAMRAEAYQNYQQNPELFPGFTPTQPGMGGPAPAPAGNPRQPGELSVAGMKQAAGEMGGPGTQGGAPPAEVPRRAQIIGEAIVKQKRRPGPTEIEELAELLGGAEAVVQYLKSLGI